jgi:hypothetical protein
MSAPVSALPEIAVSVVVALDLVEPAGEDRIKKLVASSERRILRAVNQPRSKDPGAVRH